MHKFQHNLKRLPLNQAGFSLVEALVAIIAVGVLAITVAPIITLSLATRLQAKRSEQAAQAASSYIESVKAGAIAAPPVSSTTKLKDVAAPSAGTLSCSGKANQYCTSPGSTTTWQLFCIDGDTDGSCTIGSIRDMVIQSAGYNSFTTSADSGYQLGTRVYRSAAFESGTTLKKGVTQLTFTGGTGLGSQQAPLAEMTTEVVTGQTKYQDLCARLGGC